MGLGRVYIIFLIFWLSGCAYRLGYAEREIPGGYELVAIPVFKNETTETGIEVPFTNALVVEFERSRVARVVEKTQAPVVVEGTVKSVSYIPTSAVKGGQNSELDALPSGAVLTTEYRINLLVYIILRRMADNKILWEGNFTNERAYSAPRIGTPDVNSANALYNQSIRLQSISRLATEMMEEAHNRITENF